MVCGVSFDDQEISLQTAQAVVLVSTVPVIFEQPLRTNSGIITSIDRILDSPQSILGCLSLYFSNCIRADFDVCRSDR